MNEYMLEQAEKDAYESALRFNPETLEYDHPADGPFVDSLPERFIIDSDKKIEKIKADWAIEKIKDERAEFDRLRKIALDRIAELNQLEALLVEYFQRVKELQERTDRRTGNTVKPTKLTKT